MSICYLLDGVTPPARQNGKSLPCERLQAENDKLCEENQHIGLIAYELGRTSLAQENAKLRELCHELATLADQACHVIPSCRKCPMLGAETCDLTSAFQRMHELGVDV